MRRLLIGLVCSAIIGVILSHPATAHAGMDESRKFTYHGYGSTLAKATARAQTKYMKDWDHRAELGFKFCFSLDSIKVFDEDGLEISDEDELKKIDGRDGKHSFKVTKTVNCWKKQR